MLPNKKFVFMFPWVLKAKWIGSPTVSTLFYFYPVSEKPNPKTKFKLSRILHTLTITLQKLIQKLLHSINLTDWKAFSEGGKEGLWGQQLERRRPPSPTSTALASPEGTTVVFQWQISIGNSESHLYSHIPWGAWALGVSDCKQTCLP